MVIYALGGLGADERVFEKLDLDYPFIPIKWNASMANESFTNYCKRLCEQIDIENNFVLIGVSFGGIVATEMNKYISPDNTILISSASTRDELPSWWRYLPLSKLIRWLPKYVFKQPFFIVNYLFGAKDKILLKAIIRGTDLSFIKWALIQILKWNNKTIPDNSSRIHGDKDRLIPLLGQCIVIENGHHFMVVDRAAEISLIINDIINDAPRT